MIRPDFRQFKHSAKGSVWENHKYVKRLDGTYYYPDSYEGGRHISDLERDSKNQNEEESSEMVDLSENDIENLALEVIRGNFGNGQIRKDLLAGNYEAIQKRVNELMRTRIGSKKVDEASSEVVQEGKKQVSKTITKVTQASKGLDMNQVFDVYDKKKKLNK